MHYAAYARHADAVLALVAACADPNVKDVVYKTPLQLTLVNEHTDVVELLDEVVASRRFLSNN